MNVQYIKSSFCPAGACVEAAMLVTGDVELRDGKNHAKESHVFTAQEWVAFVRGVKSDEFNFNLPDL